ncbi:MAG: c-type cytochrome [Alphaproteobacteria bacterium]|nr:c-type cytochrome [Alphaproteobacteria bacterium]
MIRSTQGLIALSVLATFLTAGMAAAADGDVTRGKKVFNKCRACHATVANVKRVGPSLFGVVGRKCGTAANVRYSKGYKAACQKLGFTWDDARIDEYVTDPSKYISELAGKRYTSPMRIKLKKAQDRADVIAYLNTLR